MDKKTEYSDFIKKNKNFLIVTFCFVATVFIVIVVFNTARRNNQHFDCSIADFPIFITGFLTSLL